MTIKQKLIVATATFIIVLFALGLTIHCGYHYVMNKASLANDFDKESMYLQMMLRGLNEVIINDGTPSSLRTEKEGMHGFDEIHARLMAQVKDPDIRRIMTEELDPAWKGIKKDIKPFLEHYVDLNDDELMIEAGKLIIKTEHIIKHVAEFSEKTRAIVNKNSKISATVISVMEFFIIPLLLSSVILAFHIYRTISRPIKELTAVAEGFNRGNLNVMMDESRRDEFGTLARFFNRSTANIDETNKKLQEEITERKNAEDLLKLQLERINALHSFEKRVGGIFVIDEVLELLINDFILNLGIDAGAMLILNEQTQKLEYTISRGFRTSALKYTQLEMGESHAGAAAREGRVVYISDLKQNSQGFKRSIHLVKEEFISYFAVPLITKGKVKGVLELFHRSQFNAEQDWMNFLETISSQAAIAIEKAELVNDLKLSRNELLLAYDETIGGWSRALDLRDRETEGHSQRVTNLTVQIAQAFGINHEQLLHIKRGALLHDIGKMGIPDNILLKPGALTEEEWKIMKLHPEYAYDMLYKINYLKPALEIPYCHHEKWDGTGYPKGIKGQEIPLSARIFAVVDVWDALRSDRPYRPAWSKEKTLDHIQSQAGTHFDPEVVEEFLKVVSKAQCDKEMVL